MKGYDNYKDTNDIWIEKIPNNWEFSYLKYYVDIIGGYAFKSEDYSENIGYPIIRIGDISCVVDVCNAKKANPNNIHELDRFIIKRGDLLIAMTGATIGKNCMYESNEIAYLNQRVGLLRASNKVNQHFLKYIIDASFFREFINLQCSGAAQDNIGTGEISQFNLPIPTLVEQTQIAAFLDYKTNLIDATIEKKKRLITLLKEKRQAVINETVIKGLNPNAPMKDSGVEWLGEIPEHWKFQKAKRNTYMKGRIGWQGLKQEEFIDEGPYLITGMNFKDGVIRWDEVYHITKERYDEAPEIQLKNGDVLMTKDGTIGKLLYVDNLPGPASLNSHLLVLRCIDNSYIPKYLYYQLMTNLFSVHVELNKTGTTFFGITQEAVGRFKMLLPPVSEQQEIVNYIENQISIFDRSVNKIELIIENLKAYRQSLISEAVTGKIDVREWQITNN